MDSDSISNAQACPGRGGTESKLKFQSDREADILYINVCPPYPQQEAEELENEVIARLNPQTGEVESLEALFVSTRLLRGDLFELRLTPAP